MSNQNEQTQNQLANNQTILSLLMTQFDSTLDARYLANQSDEKLIKFLLNQPKLSELFFSDIDGVKIFKKDEFIEFLDTRELDSSYTKFSNKIGLSTAHNKFIKQQTQVVLSFPYKDCVLKGGQSRDDEKNKEIFYNNILAKNEIDILLSPKVLSKFELVGGGNSLSETLKHSPNLLIKGNNLIALYCLKAHLKHKPQNQKVKLIYIDPPYNTGNDSFNYNDRFNHSTYLTFMKNRLEIARELLRDDGVIFVQCDDNEQAYLKVLMDEIFGRENFDTCITHIVKPEGRMYGNIAKTHEYILVYAKNITLLEFNEIEKSEHKFEFEDEFGGFNLQGLRNRNVKKNNSLTCASLRFPFFVSNEIDKNGFYKVFTEFTNNTTEVYPSIVDGLESIWRWSKEKCVNEPQNICARKNADNTFSIFQKSRKSTTRAKSIFWDKEMITQKGTQEIKALFANSNTDLFSTPKPEALLKRIIEISTNQNDLVLDFFAGSGTTLAVAHKMKRRYIGIEQMDYIESITKARLSKVIDGESGGVSKAVNFTGGGSFIYCELAGINALIIEKILNANDELELRQIYDEIRQKAEVDYRFSVDKILSDEFEDLELDAKKAILINALDRNMDYIPYGDIDDSSHEIDEQTKELNEIFYKG